MKIGSSIISPDRLTQLKSFVYDIIGCCQDVHKELGPWLNEYSSVSNYGITCA